MEAYRTPVVSIILPAYNAENYIGEAVLSVFRQTLENWELIIVNDGSKDGTRDYLDTITDLRIKIIHQDNRGVSSARNRALDVIEGQFVTFLDADDVLPPRSLEVRVKYLFENPEVDVVDGVVSIRNEVLTMDMNTYRPYYHGELLPRLSRLDSRVFFNIAYMLRANKIGSLRFHQDMSHAEDLLFYMEFSCANKCIYGHVNEPIYIYRKNSGSAMSNIDGLEKGYLKLIESIGTLACLSRFELLVLPLKIAKILFLSWVSTGKYFRSITSVVKVLSLLLVTLSAKR